MRRDDAAQDAGANLQPIIPPPPTFQPCSTTGIFIPLYRDGVWECIEIPAHGDVVLTFQDGVPSLETISDCP
jgi:hypothetical protein